MKSAQISPSFLGSRIRIRVSLAQIFIQRFRISIPKNLEKKKVSKMLGTKVKELITMFRILIACGTLVA